MYQNRTVLALVCASFAVTCAITGCNSPSSLIDHATFKVGENLETIRVSLVFAPNVQPDIGGSFQLGPYGQLFLNPFTPTLPFELGFDLNTSVVNDQSYVKLIPTLYLPNGTPTGIGYPVVQVHAGAAVNLKFDVYAYIDVLHGAWLGSSAMLNFINNQWFPSGLAISQVFMRDTFGNPGISASVFGPTLKSDGSMDKPGGIAVFGNMKQLLGHPMATGTEVVIYPEKGVQLDGPDAPYYNAHPEELRKIQQGVVDGLNHL